MRFTSPIFRFGAVISASKSRAGARTATTLDASGSRQLGRLIVRHKNKYQKVFSQAVAKEGIEIEWQAGDCNVYLTPGVIIDFPCFLVKWNYEDSENCIVGRPCFATCLNKSQSKIWFRFVLKGELPSGDAGDKVTNGYFAFVQEIARSLIDVALDRYNFEFSRFLGQDIRMKLSYAIRFISGDLQDARELLSLPPRKVFNAVGKSRPNLKRLFTSKEEGTIGGNRYIEFNVDENQKGVFVRTFGRKNATLKGLYLYSDEAFNIRDRKIDAFYQQSGALGLTAKLANIIGQEF